MTKGVRTYVTFVGLVALGAVGLMAMKIAPAAQRWREILALRRQGEVIRLPNQTTGHIVGAADPYGNIAPFARVTVSSAEATNGTADQGVADGVVDRREWISEGQTAGAEIALEWEKPALVEEIDLYDRVSPESNVLSGMITFDDGTQIPVGALPTDGAPARFQFPTKVVRWLAFRIDSAEGTNAGLEEIIVRGRLGR